MVVSRKRMGRSAVDRPRKVKEIMTTPTCQDCGKDIDWKGRCVGCQMAVEEMAKRQGRPSPTGNGHDLINVTHIKNRLKPLKLRIGDPALRLLQVLVEGYVEAGATGIRNRSRVTISPEDILRGAGLMKMKAAGSCWDRAWTAGLAVEAMRGRV